MLCVSGSTLCGRDRLASDAEEWNGELKILVLGASGVGKSALCRRFFQGKPGSSVSHSNETFREKLEDVDGEISVLRIIDISAEFPSKQVNQNLKKTILMCEGFVVVYSVTDRGSLNTVERLVPYIQHVRRPRDSAIVMVGNKMDSWAERCISQNEGRRTAFELGVAFYESSAHAATYNVNKLFHEIVRQIRCVRSRREMEHKQRRNLSPSPVRSRLAKGITSRLSLRSKSKSKSKTLKRSLSTEK